MHTNSHLMDRSNIKTLSIGTVYLGEVNSFLLNISFEANDNSSAMFQNELRSNAIPTGSHK